MSSLIEKTRTEIESEYLNRTPKSAVLSEQAKNYLPSGVVHDSRFIKPYSLYSSHSKGAYKWDVDGNRYIDYFGGHGSLMLGHNHPTVIEATTRQLTLGSHFATNTEMEIRWAEKIIEMIPCAERVRFHSSGTEATQMAVRLARAYSGKNKIVRFAGHYHGWLDDMTTGYASHFDGTAVIGVPDNVAQNSIVIDPYEMDCLDKLVPYATDIAAVIIEPLGAATGKVPIKTEFLQLLRNWTKANNVLLIFDEVVTGFRVSPGGVQAATNIIPDITALAKIVAGGLPGAAVAGSTEILGCLDHVACAKAGREKIIHPGTFNACPVSAAAGIETLTILQNSDACSKASRLASQLRDGLNTSILSAGLPWYAYGESSAFQIYLGNEDFKPEKLGRSRLYEQPEDATRLLRLSMNNHGVDFAGWPGGMVSAAHEPEDIEYTIEAFAKSIQNLSPLLGYNS